MTRSNDQGKSRHSPCGKTTPITKGHISGRNGGRNHAGLNGWNSAAFLSASEVDADEGLGSDFKSPNYFKSLEHEDPDLYYAIIESLRTSTSDPEYHPQTIDTTVSILDIAKPAKGKKSVSLREKVDAAPSNVQSSGVLKEEDFEVWGDDVYEQAMWEDDWEEIHDEQLVDSRQSYSSTLRGNDNNK